ncbi:MAG: hypothetical protein AAF604_03020 [Acidobacteriota bacterium]
MTQRATPGLALAVLLITLLAPACSVPRGGLPWPARVEPTETCPADPVTVTWDLGPNGGCERNPDGVLVGSGCRDPIRVDITSSPDVFAGDPIAAEETRGSRVVRPTEDTTFQFNARDRDDTMESYTRAVDVFTEDAEVNGVFGGACCGSRICWSELTTIDARLPATIRLVEVCNPNPYAIRVNVENGSGEISSFELAPATGEAACTDELRNVVRATASTTDPTVIAGALCGPTAERPPGSIPVQTTWRCPAV